MNIENIIEICIAIDIAILSIAYPILVDKISNIGLKYNSEYLTNVFDYEFPQTKISNKISIFQLILIFTVISFVFKIFLLKPIQCLEGIILIENSADILIFLLTTILTISFFYWLNKIMLYQGKASKLLKYLINRYKLTINEGQQRTYILKTINEFAIYAIERQDKHLQTSLIEFYSLLFYNHRENSNESEGAIYPFDLYSINNEIINTSASNKNRKLKALEHRASSGIWLIGESFQYSKISKETYSWLWKNIVDSSKNYNLISNYWSSASQYFHYSLFIVTPEYDGSNITNQEDIDKVNNEREKFLELNFALGGLLYYQNNFKILKYILSFSQSQPPSYPLLPQIMDDIFDWFEHFSNDLKNLDEPIDYKYHFPRLDNLGISRNINHNICLYISLLFVRQFTLNKIYIYQNFKIFHNLTDNLQKLYSYNNILKYFKNCINEILLNTELLHSLNYLIQKDEILTTFDNLSEKIIERIDLTKLKTQLSVDKINLFNNTTKNIISRAFDDYLKIENKTNFRKIDNIITSSINGMLTISSKSSFTDNDIPNINFDSVYAQNITDNKIRYFLPNSFLMARTSRYLIERNQLIESLDKILKTTNKKMIIAIRPRYDTSQIILNSRYNDILIEIPSTNNQLNDTFFILDEKDLPKFEFKNLESKEIDKFKLIQIDDKIKLYTSILDINLPINKDLKDEFITNDDDELKVLILISFIFLIKWRKNRKIIMLSLASPYEERGILNDVNEIKSI